MAPYNIESEARTLITRGPFGIFKQEVVSVTPGGQLNEGETIELFNGLGEKVGDAVLKDNVLRVIPVGNVVVDMGDIKGFKSTLIIPGKNGDEERVMWVGDLQTSGDMTVRTEDNSQKVHLHKVAQDLSL